MTDYRPWKPEEDKVVLDSKKTPAQIAKELGRSVAAVSNRKWRLQNPGRHYNFNKNWRKKSNASARLRHEAKARNYRKGEGNKRNEYQLWSEQEDTAILDPNKPSDRELAKILGPHSPRNSDT